MVAMTFQHPRVKEEALNDLRKRSKENPDACLFMSADVIDYTDEELKAINWMNERYFVTTISDGMFARFRVVYEKDDERVIMTHNKFIQSLKHMKILAMDQNGRIKPIPITTLWLESPLRREKNI
jgi:hypothetical protein